MSFLNYGDNYRRENLKFKIKKSRYYTQGKGGYEIKLFRTNVEGDIFPMGSLDVTCPDNSNLWNIHVSLVPMYRKKGFGAILYDKALEFVSEQLNGYIISTVGSERGSTSFSAERIWKYYYFNRDDVIKKIIHENTEKPWLYTAFKKT